MSPVYPTLPRLAVRDSFDDEDLSDVDDEVFIRDGKNGGMKLDDEVGVKRPLMAPRRKCKINHRSIDKRRLNCKSLLAPCCYATIALLVLTGLITLVIFAVSVFPVPLTFLKNWLAETMQDKINKNVKDEIAACTFLSSTTVWTKSFPKLTSEAPLRSLDINGDNIEDIIVAFGTGLNDVEDRQYICNVYFGGQTPCLGGILALDGTTGDTLWTHWSWHVIFSLDCILDLNNDHIKDCVAAGRGGTLRAVSGRDGSTLWAFPSEDSDKSSLHRILDVYDANFVSDLDGDEIGDVVAAHTMQIGTKRSSEIVIVSGKTGGIIHRVAMNNKEQLYLAPQTLVHLDGEKLLILVTGSHEQSGGLYIAPFSNLLYGELKLRELHHDSEKGILSQPILADITEDGTDDIVVAMFNSVIVAYDGRSFDQIWNYTVLNSEITSSPIPGYYNDDDIPDFMVKHQLGPGYPVYYYTVATILDGKTGKPLLETELEDSLSGQMSGLSVTVDGYGNDWFLHWSADCLHHEGDRSPYQFLKTTSLPSQLGADLCKLRFNSSLSTKLLAFSQHVAPPGLPLYVSEKWRKLEYNSSIDPRKEAEKYSEMHPDYEGLNPEPGVSSITERSLRVHSSRRGRPSSSVDNGNDIFSEQTNNYRNPDGAYNFNERKDNIVNNPETNISDDFGSNEDWREVNKWEDDNKDYNVLYDERDEMEKENGIREQRSGSIDAREINNETNDVKNELDSSMDYTNGQGDDNYRSMGGNNRTTKLKQIINYHSDFDFDESLNDQSIPRIKEKRTTTEFNDNESDKGQKEIIVGSLQNSERYEPFLKIIKRPAQQLVLKKNESQSPADESEVNDIENMTKKKETILNLTIVNINETRNASEQSDLTTKIYDKDADVNVTEKEQVVTDKINAKDTWLTRDIFSKLMRNSEEDANIEKIFKRESMKNRKGFGSNRINVKRVKNIEKIKSKRETESVETQTDNVDGVQRESPTGILLPSINKLGKTLNSIDLVFSTSWLPPSDASVILIQQDLDCIHKKRKESLSSNSGNKNQQQQQQRAQFVLECLAERGIDYKVLQEGTDRENVKISLGQMTVYRMKLECICPEDLPNGHTCRSISSHQSWPAHLGPLTNGYFRPLRKPAS